MHGAKANHCMSQTRDQKRFTTAWKWQLNWHELITLAAVHYAAIRCLHQRTKEPAEQPADVSAQLTVMILSHPW